MELLQNLLDLAASGNWAAQGALYAGYALAALGLLQTGLSFVAPKTKTTLDDKVLAFSYKALPFLKSLHEKFNQAVAKKKK